MKQSAMVPLSELGVNDLAMLPDWVFGRRWCAGFQVYSNAASGVGVADEQSMPDRVMVWSLTLWSNYSGGAGQYVRIGLGNGAPATEAAILECEPLFRGLGQPGAEPRRIVLDKYMYPYTLPMRLLVERRNRQIVGWYNDAAATARWALVAMSVSAVPTELPVWVARHLGFYV